MSDSLFSFQGASCFLFLAAVLAATFIYYHNLQLIATIIFFGLFGFRLPPSFRTSVFEVQEIIYHMPEPKVKGICRWQIPPNLTSLADILHLQHIQVRIARDEYLPNERASDKLL